MPSIKRSILYRIFFSGGCVLAFSGLVIWYIINIQIVEGDNWRALSDSLTLKYKNIQAIRGNIYSDNGTLLATSVPRYEIRMDLSVLPDDTFNKYIGPLAIKFSQKFKDKSALSYQSEFLKEKKDTNRYYLLKRKLSYLDIKEIKTWPLLNKGRFKSGLIIEEENYRVMPFKNLLARTIGYASQGKNKERVGIEGAFDKDLAGSTGRRLVQKISGGYRPVNDDNEVEPVDGKDIYTTIDITMQDIVNNALHNGLVKHNAHHGCAVIMEVSTGEIKAVVNLTESGYGNYLETFNYAIGESFEPGSTFKLITALALLNKVKIKETDTVLINYGEYKINNRMMVDAEPSLFKSETFAYAFQHSSNVGISTSAIKGFNNNPTEFTDFIKDLGLDKPIGLELPGEGIPVIKVPGNISWSKMSLPWMSIGYEVKVTPLQLLSVYNAVANNGKMMKPFVIKAIGQKGEIEKTFKPILVKEEIADANTLKTIKKLLKGVVTNGTARNISKSIIQISGKTGTALISDGKGYEAGAYFSSFAGYFPSDKPKYSIIVVVNRPSAEGYFGGVVAAPIVKEIAEKILGIQQIDGIELADSLSNNGLFASSFAGNKNNILSFLARYTNSDYHTTGNKSDWINAKISIDDEFEFTPISNDENLMPDLTGMGMKDALYFIDNKKLKVITEGKGLVYWQSIKPGNKIIKGTSVIIRLKI